jgi:hypothetical protein
MYDEMSGSFRIRLIHLLFIYLIAGQNGRRFHTRFSGPYESLNSKKNLRQVFRCKKKGMAITIGFLMGRS